MMLAGRDVAEWTEQARARTLILLDETDDVLAEVPLLPTVNPPLWEICHAVFFREHHVLRGALGRESMLPRSDEALDSLLIAHEARWRVELLPRDRIRAYVNDVTDAVLDALSGTSDERLIYLAAWAVFHEDMHWEAIAATRQAMGHPAPSAFGAPRGEAPPADCGGRAEDLLVPGGEFLLGAAPDGPFAFDNEKWAHPVTLAPFAISSRAVTEGEFAAFVLDGGYERREFWDDLGWAFRQAVGAERPLYWLRVGKEEFLVRRFDRLEPLRPERAVSHVSFHEAQAFCRWAGRRLPTEAEWEAAACGLGAAGGKRRRPWGDHPNTGREANLDGWSGGAVDVSLHPAGDSPFGCRQMLGNVWEWTSTTFEPYPGFEPDMYAEFSRPCFHTRKVLRGGCWATTSRQVWNTLRNFYQPTRRDIFAGFRTCPLAEDV